MKKIITIALAVLLGSVCAFAQRFSIGTNAVDLLTFGTLNAEGSVSVHRNVSVHVGTEFNPWTFNSGDPQNQVQNRQISYWAGARWWPWHVYSGWWVGADGRYTMYNIGGITQRETEEGDAMGAGLYAGYSIMLNSTWNIDLGLGFWGGYKKYTTYSCPLCGVTVDSGEKAWLTPDARVAIQLIF